MWDEFDSGEPRGGTSRLDNLDDDSIERKDSAQLPSSEVTAEQVRNTVQTRLTDLRSRLSSTKDSPATTRSLDDELTGLAAAQRAGDVMAESYARPNMFMNQSRRKDEQNNNQEKLLRQRSSSLTARKSSPRLERRHSDHEVGTDNSYLISKGSNGRLIDLVNDKLEEIQMSPEDQRYSAQLLADARQASERFKNRRGRRFSSEDSSLSSNGERSPFHSNGSSPQDRSPPAERRSSSETSTSSSSKTNEHSPLEGSLEALTAVKSTPLELLPSNQRNDDLQERGGISERGEHVDEERTGAEGESDTEDNKSPNCSTPNRPRSDSDMDDIDIKADILRNIGPIQTEGGQLKSKEPLAKRRDEQKLKRNVSFKMPQLSEAQEVNGVKETDTTTTTSNSVTQDSDVPVDQSLKENGAVETSSPRLRKQNEVEVDSPPRLLPNSLLQALQLLPRESSIATMMSEQEVEDKYNALASALKLDKHTLDKRVELMQHQRDHSEESIQKELAAVEQCLVTLELQCENNPTSKDCIDRLRKQAEDLKRMSVWLAGRAEGLGAVQEEGRLSDAAEIMVLHVENLRRLFEREHAELEETRKLLQENRAFFRGSVSPSPLGPLDDSRLFNRRAFSITPGSRGSLKRKIGTFDMSGSERIEEVNSRRRASVAVLGFAGTQLASSSSQEGRSRWSLVANKAKWGSSLPASGQTTDGVSSQTSSTEGDESLAPSPGSFSANASLQTTPCHTPRSGSIKGDDTDTPKPSSPSRKTVSGERSSETKTKKEEEIYHEGFEQGVRSRVSEELGELREEQKEFRENLENLMENAAEEEEQDEIEQQEQESNAQRNFLRWPVLHSVRQRNILRLGFAIFIIIIVLLSLIQNLPMHICGPGKPVRNDVTYTICELLLPLAKLRHTAPPPV